MTELPAETYAAPWLYLLPVGPGATALDLGSGTGDPALALARLCDRVEVVEPDADRAAAIRERAARAGLGNVSVLCADPAQLAACPGRFDVVVVAHPGQAFADLGARRGAALLRSLVRPSGCIVTAAHHRHGAYGAGRLRSALRAAGFVRVQAYAALPNPARARHLIPGDNGESYAAAMRHLFGQLTSARQEGHGAFLRLAAHLPLPSLLSGCWLIARAPGSLRAGLAEEMLRQIAAQRPPASGGRDEPAQRVCALIRHRPLTFLAEASAGAAAAFYAFPDGWGAPRCVLKVGPAGERPAGAPGEAELLQRLRTRLPRHLRDSVPVPLGGITARGQRADAELCLPGPTLWRALAGGSAAARRRRVESLLPAVADWLAELHLHTSDGILRRDLEGEQAVRRALCRVVGVENPALAHGSRFAPLFRGIARAGIRLAVAHNNLQPRHIVLRRPSGIGVTEWGGATLNDLPAIDLFHLVRMMAQAWAGSNPEATFEYAFRNGWLARAGWEAVRRYCERAHLDEDAAWLCLPLYYLRQEALCRAHAGAAETAPAYARVAERALEWVMKGRAAAPYGFGASSAGGSPPK